MKYELFGYQEEATEAGIKVLTNPKKCFEVLVAPTGAGKAIIIAAIVKRLPKDGNILIIQPNKELTEQNVEKAESMGTDVSVYSASLGRKEFGRVIYATPRSLKTHDFKDKNIKYAIVDECDANTRPGTGLPLFLRNIGVRNCLGLTATPIYLQNTQEGAQLKIMTRIRAKTFSDICYNIPASELIKMGRWSKIDYIDHEYNRNKLKLNANGSDFTEKSVLAGYVESKQEDQIKSLLSTIPEKESVLIFIPGVENVKALSEYIKGSAYVTATTSKSERDRLVKKFKSGEIRVMINAGIFSIGFDYPDLRNVIDAFPTNSARTYIQRVGRLVRVSKETGKLRGVYHCMSGNFKKFGKVEDITYEKIEGYGWGMFAGEYLISAVPMSENLNVTKTNIVEKYKGVKKSVSYDFDFDFDTLTEEELNFKIPFGKYEGRTVKWVYIEDKRYLSWLINPETNFKFYNTKTIFLKNLLMKIFKV